MQMEPSFSRENKKWHTVVVEMIIILSTINGGVVRMNINTNQAHFLLM